MPVTGEEGIVAAHQQARQAAKDLGFGLVDQSRIATAVSELARNVVRYATGSRGEVLIRALPPSEKGIGIEMIVRDEGPGMANVEQALRDGFTPATGWEWATGDQAFDGRDDYRLDPQSLATVTIRKWRR